MVPGDREVVLHVGTHKTGTTLLQRYLTRHVDELLVRGVHYVEREEMAGYVGWGERLRDDPDGFRRRIDAGFDAPGCRVVFASHEDLIGPPFPPGGDGRIYPRARANLETLGAALAGHRLRAVLSIRPQHEFLESYYLQTVHEGGHVSFERWLERVDLDALSYRPLLDALSAVCGAGNVTIIDFGLIGERNGAFLARCLHAIDPVLDDLDATYSRPHNRSLSAKGLQMALAVNPRIKDPQRRRAVRFFLQRHYSNADQPRAVLLADGPKRTLLERYRQEYEQLVGVHA